MLMCLYPTYILNKKYIPNKKNGGKPPTMEDDRKMYVPIPCGKCKECMKKKSREWAIRLKEELRLDAHAKMVCFSFSNEHLKALMETYNEKESNALATIAVRHFLERWRKTEKISLKHFLITELGHENTERIHLHGIIWTTASNEFIERKWMYGNCKFGTYVNERTINYITKYITKIDKDHKNFVPVILCSPGIGKNWYDRNKELYEYKGTKTPLFYRTTQNWTTALPMYYKTKLYNEEQRDKLFTHYLDTGKMRINGTSVKRYEPDIIQNSAVPIYDKYSENVLKSARQLNDELGYGNNTKEWRKKDYNVTSMIRKRKLLTKVLETGDITNCDTKERKYITKKLAQLD